MTVIQLCRECRVHPICNLSTSLCIYCFIEDDAEREGVDRMTRRGSVGRRLEEGFRLMGEDEE